MTGRDPGSLELIEQLDERRRFTEAVLGGVSAGVLALDADPAAHCDGVALRVQPGAEETTLRALRARELISSAYLERWLPVDLADGRQTQALVFVIDPGHGQYCGGLALEEQAQIIARAVGGRGDGGEPGKAEEGEGVLQWHVASFHMGRSPGVA